MNINALFQLLPVCRVNAHQPLLEAADFVTSFKLLHASDSCAAMLNGNDLQLVLFISTSVQCILSECQVNNSLPRSSSTGVFKILV